MAHEIDFLPVGSGTKSGDAICLRYSNSFGGFDIHVVDGGYTENGPLIVDHIKNIYQEDESIQNVVLTHQDADHVSGLFDVVEAFQVGTLWMNRPWLYAADIQNRVHGNWTVAGLEAHLKEQFSVLVELEELALSKGTIVAEAFQGTRIGPFLVLGPSKERYLDLLLDIPGAPAQVKSKRASVMDALLKLAEEAKVALTKFINETWYGETLSENPGATSASNECSIIQGSVIDGTKILLTGDTGPAGLAEAYQYASQFNFSQPDVIQVPHHGSRRNVTPSTLDDWLGMAIGPNEPRRGIAICSAAKNDLDHPKAKVENAFLRRGYPVFTTNGALIRHGIGLPDRGYSAAKPAPFRKQVED